MTSNKIRSIIVLIMSNLEYEVRSQAELIEIALGNEQIRKCATNMARSLFENADLYLTGEDADDSFSVAFPVLEPVQALANEKFNTSLRGSDYGVHQALIEVNDKRHKNHCAVEIPVIRKLAEIARNGDRHIIADIVFHPINDTLQPVEAYYYSPESFIYDLRQASLADQA